MNEFPDEFCVGSTAFVPISKFGFINAPYEQNLWGNTVDPEILSHGVLQYWGWLGGILTPHYL